jgi:hypothetical protein
VITPDEAKVLLASLTLIENDAFLCGEASGTDQWLGAFQRLRSDQAVVVAFINDLTERSVQVS